MVAVRFVDVFSDVPFRGNALAVVHDGDRLSDEDMAAIARWTNLSETTFLCAPTARAPTTASASGRPAVSCRSRVTPRSAPPTRGWKPGPSCTEAVVVQQCAAGLVEVRRGYRLAFAAPPLLRSGPVGAEDAARFVAALRLDPAEVVDLAWVDNGPGWVGVLLRHPDIVLAADPDPVQSLGLTIGLAAVYPPGTRDDGVAAEVRAFYSDARDFGEDPVTGSLNAGLAEWLVAAGRLPRSYVAAQGTVIDRLGRVHVDVVDDTVWVGGAAHTLVVGELSA